MRGAQARLVSAPHAEDRGALRNRLASSSGAAARQTGKLTQEAEAAAEIESLRRTRVLLERQLAQMDDTMEAVASSDATLAALGAKVEGVDGVMATNTSLVGRLKALEASDDQLVSVGWFVFFLVLAYVWSDRVFGLSLSPLSVLLS